jgi:hypothetical protein
MYAILPNPVTKTSYIAKGGVILLYEAILSKVQTHISVVFHLSFRSDLNQIVLLL